MPDEAYDKTYTRPDTYTDDKGRRRIDRDGTHQDTKQLSPQELQQKLVKLQADFEKMKSDFYSMTITGPGFAGKAPNISFQPNIVATPNCDTSPPTLTISLT